MPDDTAFWFERIHYPKNPHRLCRILAGEKGKKSIKIIVNKRK